MDCRLHGHRIGGVDINSTPTFLGPRRLFISEKIEKVKRMKGKEKGGKRKETEKGKEGGGEQKREKRKEKESVAKLNWVLLEPVGDIS